jgi:hypothetical protein
MKTPKRQVMRIHDAITLYALAADPDVRIRVQWLGGKVGRWSYYHGPCAVAADVVRLIDINPQRARLHAVCKQQDRWAHWRATCSYCRAAINQPFPGAVP